MNVFKPGDTVFTPAHGQGYVMGNRDTFYGYQVRVDCGTFRFKEEELSFEPWPAPVHVRPIKVGWYVVWIHNHAHPYLYHWNGNKWDNNTIQCSMENLMSCDPKFKYLGEELNHD